LTITPVAEGAAVQRRCRIQEGLLLFDGNLFLGLRSGSITIGTFVPSRFWSI
jgi:hypothetical protein